MNKQVDVCVIGGGAAGMAAALGAKENGAQSVMIIEKDPELGGILLQCIHNGFGLHHFKEELTGPAYAQRVKTDLLKTDVEVKCDTTVIKLTKDKQVHYMNAKEGYVIADAKAIITAIGCRERTRHQIEIPGKRLAGIMTAGTAQRYLNIDGYLIGKRVFILGSGDIGLIMARRMTLEGAKVLGVAEIMPYSNGLNRNIVQCLHDFEIPLYLSHTVTEVRGKSRLESLTLAQVDKNFQMISGTEKEFQADTLLLSVGLIPENTLLKDMEAAMNPVTGGAFVDNHFETNIPGVFACGNSLHVHDLVDYVSEEGYEAGKNAADYLKRTKALTREIQVMPGKNVRYTVPNVIRFENNEIIELKFRVTKPFEKAKLFIRQGNQIVKEMIKNNLFPAEMEIVNIPSISLNQNVAVTVEIEGGENHE